MKRIVIAITGATGTIYGVRLLEELNRINVETHVVLSDWALKNLLLETNYTEEELKKMSSYYYHENRLDALISSGSFIHDGMVVIPTSMKTLAAIANGFSSNLICRAADVSLKERRTLILAVRETPFNAIQLENMLKLSRLGVTIMPPVPAFYNKPSDIADLINHFVGRVLDCLGIDNPLCTRWDGVSSNRRARE